MSMVFKYFPIVFKESIDIIRSMPEEERNKFIEELKEISQPETKFKGVMYKFCNFFGSILDTLMYPVLTVMSVLVFILILFSIF